MRHCVIIENYDHTMTHFKAYIIVESFAKLVTTLLFSGWCGSTWACWTCWTGGECSLTWNILFLPSRWEVQHQKYLLTIRTHCSTPLSHNITTQIFCQRRFLYNFSPLRNNHNPLRPVSHLASSLFWKTSVCTQVRRLLWKLLCSFMASKLQANTNRKAACKRMKVSSCTSQRKLHLAVSLDIIGKLH